MGRTQEQQKFIATVWRFYKKHGRHDLPWRTTTDPYCILVSEFMLQQTQVARVIDRYENFILRWPSVECLAKAPLGEVLTFWQGLGYNRRAKHLAAAAKIISEKYDGVFPETIADLEILPGVGPYTAAAVATFAYNQPVILLETNIRQVFLYHFFATTNIPVSDSTLRPLIAATVPYQRAREWYWALMDYGTHLKKVYGNLGTKSAHYHKQSRFKGSTREVRGAIIRNLVKYGAVTSEQLAVAMETFSSRTIANQLQQLVIEGLVVYEAGVQQYRLP